MTEILINNREIVGFRRYLLDWCAEAAWNILCLKIHKEGIYEFV